MEQKSRRVYKRGWKGLEGVGKADRVRQGKTGHTGIPNITFVARGLWLWPGVSLCVYLCVYFLCVCESRMCVDNMCVCGYMCRCVRSIIQLVI